MRVRSIIKGIKRSKRKRSDQTGIRLQVVTKKTSKVTFQSCCPRNCKHWNWNTAGIGMHAKSRTQAHVHCRNNSHRLDQRFKKVFISQLLRNMADFSKGIVWKARESIVHSKYTSLACDWPRVKCQHPIWSSNPAWSDP